MTPEQLRTLKASPGKTLLFYLSDYCPVGCAHCSVDAIPSAPRANRDPAGQRSLAHIRELCRGIRTIPGLDVVGISGGEPLAERDAICATVAELAGHVKLVLFTSGLPWIGGRQAPWADELLTHIDTCVVSYSPFHERALGRDDYIIPIVEHILGHGCDVQIHALADANAHQTLNTQLRQRPPTQSADGRAPRAYLVPIPMLSVGRAARFQLHRPHKPLAEWGPCTLVTAPVLRSDGHLIACCNETLTRTPDDPALTWTVQTGDELIRTYQAHAQSELSRRLRSRGPIALIRDLKTPTAERVRAQEFDSICNACAATRSLYANATRANTP